MKTIVVNAFGGPGSGKTTAAWEICSELKKAGILAEYVSEYAKELVYEMNGEGYVAERAKKLLNGTMESQSVLFAEQKWRVDRLMGQVAVVVTDSPIMLSAIYANDKTQEFEDNIIRQFCDYTSFNFVMQRDNNIVYEETGRLQDEDAAAAKDIEIIDMLDKYGIPHQDYTHETLPMLVSRIKELSRAFSKADTEKDLTALEDDLTGVMIRQQNATSLSVALVGQQEFVIQQMDELRSKEEELE